MEIISIVNIPCPFCRLMMIEVHQDERRALVCVPCRFVSRMLKVGETNDDAPWWARLGETRAKDFEAGTKDGVEP